MQKTKKLVNHCRTNGIELYVVNKKLRYKSLKGKITKELLNELKEHKNEIIEYLEQEKESDGKIDINMSFPLTPVQSAYVLGRSDSYSLGGVSCHIYQEFIYEKLDVNRVEKIWNKIINKNPMLRAVVNPNSTQKVIEKTPRYRVMEGKRKTLRNKLENKHYILGEWPMFDIGISQERKYSVLHFSMDFLIADWLSIWNLLKEFEDMYFNCEDIQIMDNSKYTYADYIKSIQIKSRSNKYFKDKEFWKNHKNEIKAAPHLPLLEEKSDTDDFIRHSLLLRREDWEFFNKTSRENGLTPTAAILSIYNETLKRFSINKDFSIILTTFNLEERKKFGNIVGDFTNTSIISTTSTNCPFKDATQSINKQIFRNLDYSSYSGVEVLRDLSKSIGSKEFLLPFVFTSAIGLNNRDMIGKYDYGISQTPQVLIDCQTIDTPEGLRINWDVRKNKLSEMLVKDMFNYFEKNLIKLSQKTSEWNKNTGHYLSPLEINYLYGAENLNKYSPIKLLDKIEHSTVLHCSDYSYIRNCTMRDELCLGIMLKTLINLGVFKETEKNKYKLAEQYNQRDDQKYSWVIHRWIDQLNVMGIIEKNSLSKEYEAELEHDEHFYIITWERLFSRWVETHGDLNVLKYIKSNLENLEKIIKGEIDPISLLYPNGSTVYTKALYENSYSASVINDCISSVVEKIIKEKRQNKIRILEIGAGTGATTKEILKKLENVNYEYFFTDSQKYFFPEAKKTYRNNKNIKIKKLNIDLSPVDQGFDEKYFDIIIAAYVLDNTKDVPKTLEHISEIIAPDGYLLFSEPSRNEPWLMASQALLMEEPLDEYRNDCFFLTVEQWVRMLNSMDGKYQTKIFPEDSVIRERLSATLFVKKISNMNSIRSSYRDSNNEKRSGKSDIQDENNFEIPMTSLELKIKNICKNTFDVKEIKKNTNFYDIGVDSLMMAKFVTELKDDIITDLTFEYLLRECIKNPTIDGVAEIIKSGNNLENVETNENDYSIVSQRLIESDCNTKDKVLRVLINGAFGNVSDLEKLGIQLVNQNKGDVLILGVSNKDLYLSTQNDKLISRLISQYYECIVRQDYKDVQLIGYSSSGTMAIEVARRLLESGINIKNLSIIEGGILPDIKYDEIILEFIFLRAFNIDLGDFEVKDRNVIDGLIKQNVNYLLNLEVKDVIKNLKDQQDVRILKALQNKEQDERFHEYFKLIKDKQEKHITEKSFSELYKIFKKSIEIQKFVPDPYFGNIDYYIASDNIGIYKHFEKLMGNLSEIIIGDINRYDIPGNHYSSVQSLNNAKILAKKLEIKVMSKH